MKITKLQQKKAKELLELWNEYDEQTRNYDNKNWHCVNVKRYNDYFDYTDYIEKLKTTDYVKQELKDWYNDDYVNDLYQDIFLGHLGWKQLNYELEDLENITKGAKDDHKTFQYFNDKVYSLGRSGGWACFQMTSWDTIVDNLSSIIDDQGELWSYELGNTIKEVLDTVKTIFNELAYIKSYIEKFNNNLDWGEFLKYEIDEKRLELEAKTDDKQVIYNELLPIINKFQTRLKELSTKKALNDQLLRQVKSIKAILEKLIS